MSQCRLNGVNFPRMEEELALAPQTGGWYPKTDIFYKWRLITRGVLSAMLERSMHC
jgi:hypothetical protein